ncbi:MULTISPECIES: motility associated factor glycosyltransferase family protein [Aeromonas]|uniref:motility associated factor glycosyltransferase family protein n=1 Tax=Aeromonas TaxID=642 RepID=UPI00083A6799|nr:MULTISPECIES: 6-hydroxymethylpterin diphosphokinase MptE-like protein [Aeromonas]
MSDKHLIEAENELSRLAMQSEQEKAMFVTLPARFNENMTAFEMFFPHLHAELKDYVPMRPFRFFCNENGEPNLLWTDSNEALYGDSPYELAKAQVESVLSKSTLGVMNLKTSENYFNQIHDEYLNKVIDLFNERRDSLSLNNTLPVSIPMMLMFGVGLGYQLGYLYEKHKIKNLFIVEPDTDLFYASLFTFDWAPILQYLDDNNLGVHIFVGSDEDNIVEDLNTAINKRGAFWATSVCSFWHYPSDRISSVIKKVEKKFHLIRLGWGFFDDNILAFSHSYANIKNKVPFLHANKKVVDDEAQHPVFIVGNGPSLDKSIPFIVEHQQKAIIIACGSSVSALYKAGIKPDILVAVERTKSTADFLATMNAPDYLRDILFLGADVLHPDCFSYFEQSAIGFKPCEPMHILLSTLGLIDDIAFLSCVNPYVGNTGLSYAVTLGFKKLYMFGIDNGYRSKEHHHSRLSSYFDENGNVIDKLKDAVTSSGELLVPGNFGGEVISNPIFSLAIKQMETLLCMAKDICCYNITDGAKVEGAIPLTLDDIYIEEPSCSKDNIVAHIRHDFFTPLSIGDAELGQYMGFEVFNKLIDLMVGEWEKVTISHDDIIELMQRQYNYLLYIMTTSERHLQRVLEGSMNYFFFVMLNAIHSIDLDQENEADRAFVSEMINVYIDFLLKTKEKYKYALCSSDESYYELLNHFRKS